MGARAIILSSGGLDSTTVLAIAKNQGYDIHSLSFDYGQRHRFELEAAHRVADYFGVTRHLVIPMDMRSIGGSALTDDIAVPKAERLKAENNRIPVTYVPARNTVFLSYALAWAEVVNAAHIFMGVNAVDYSGYPDCRPEFINAFQAMANLATKASVENNIRMQIHTPLMDMTKAQIIRTGIGLGVDYTITHSCYDPSSTGGACGQCESCILRRKGFEEARVKDPTIYAP
jgi:7-cyano-7-deazaguanine synthase